MKDRSPEESKSDLFDAKFFHGEDRIVFDIEYEWDVLDSSCVSLIIEFEMGSIFMIVGVKQFLVAMTKEGLFRPSITLHFGLVQFFPRKI